MNKQIGGGRFDDQLDAIAHVQRRKVLVALLEDNPRADSPGAIGDTVAAVDRPVSMRHVHLPKLEDLGFIDWDRRTHEVRQGPRFDEIEPLLDVLVANQDELPADWL